MTATTLRSTPMVGMWAFHSHILPHAQSEHRMFGMVTALVVGK
jgi:manganese oxidase